MSELESESFLYDHGPRQAIDATAWEFDRYATQIAEIDTVFDYRVERHEIRQWLASQFEGHILAGQAVVMRVDPLKSRLVNYDTHASIPCDDRLIMGYVSKFYPETDIEIPFSPFAETSTDVDCTDLVGGDEWQNPKNPIHLSLGIRLKPVYLDDPDFQGDSVYIEVPASAITDIEIAEDTHPLLEEALIFQGKAIEVMNGLFDGDITSSQAEALLNDFTDERFGASGLGGHHLELIFHENAIGIVQDRQFEMRDHADFSPSDMSILAARAEINLPEASPVQVKSFQWSYKETGVSEAPIFPQLFMEVEIPAGDSRGQTTVLVSVDSIRFGFDVDKEFMVQNDEKVFDTEEKILKGMLSEARAQGLTYDTLEQCVIEFLNRVNQVSTNPTINQRVALQLSDCYELVGYTYSSQETDETQTRVKIPSGRELVGRIEDFRVSGERSEGQKDPYILCKINVSEDAFYAFQGIESLVVPLAYIEKSCRLSSLHSN